MGRGMSPSWRGEAASQGEAAGPWPGSSRVTQGRASTSSTDTVPGWPTRAPGHAGKPEPPPDRKGNPQDTWVGRTLGLRRKCMWPRLLWASELKAEVQILILRVRSRVSGAQVLCWVREGLRQGWSGQHPHPLPAARVPLPSAPPRAAGPVSQWCHSEGPRGSPSGSSPSSRSCPSPA